MDSATREYLDNMRRESTERHEKVMSEIKDVKVDIRGDESRKIKGLLPTIQEHDQLLAPLRFIEKKPLWFLGAAVILIFLVSHITVNGLDLLFKFITK